MLEDDRATAPGLYVNDEVPPIEFLKTNSEDPGDLLPTVATVAVVGIGAAVFEAALLPGLILGVAAVCVPRYFPQIGAALQPLFKSSVRGALQIGQKTREVVAEAREQVQDIVAEVDAERDRGSTTSKAKQTT
jgi:Protein of unknown function (DUF5132)